MANTRLVTRALLTVVCLLFISVPALSEQASNAALQRLQVSAKLNGAERILSDFHNGAPETRVIVSLKSSPAASALAKESVRTGQMPEAFTKPGAPTYYNLQDMSIRKRLQETVKDQVGRVIDEIGPKGVTITNRFTYQFGFSAIVTPEGLEQIVNNPDVLLIEKDRLQQPHLAQGIPLMNATAARSNYTGSGISIAISDTGIDTAHPRLGNGGSPIFNSKVIGGYDTGDDDADPRPGSSGEAHGTACAGIAGGDTGTVGDYIGGVAPGVKLYALKISYGTGGSAWDSDTIEAWEWVITHQNDDPSNPIMIISHSFGGDRYYSASSCDNDFSNYFNAAANANAAGITIFASSGNDGFCDSMGAPACVSSIISVGAVHDAAYGTYGWCVDAGSCTGAVDSNYCTPPAKIVWNDTSADMVTGYSNSASFLDVFAPSNNAYTSDIVGSGGYAAGDYTPAFGGTSAACPYAAGAGAVLQSAAKAQNGSFLTPAQVRNYLMNNGDCVTDSKVAVTKPRVNVGDAITALIDGSGGSGCGGSSGFPWAMYQPAFTGGGGSAPPPPPPANEAYWGVGNDVCCQSSSATFNLTQGSVSKKSTSPSCTQSSTWEGWATTTPGSKGFTWQLTSTGCGTVPGPSFSYTLSQGMYHLFVLELAGNDLLVKVYVSSTGSSAPQGDFSGFSADNLPESSFKLIDEIPLNSLSGKIKDMPKGVFKPTN